MVALAQLWRDAFMEQHEGSMKNVLIKQFTQTIESPLGPVRIDACADFVRGIWFIGQKWERSLNSDLERQSNPIIEQTKLQLSQYFDLNRTIFDLPLGPQGTEFQESVWREINRISFGQSNTYGAIAQNLAKPKASRAVGAATGRNPISIVIPCHRVLGGIQIGGHQALTGYAGGLDRKRWLLAHEQTANRLL